MTVTVFSKNNCPQCVHTKKALEKVGVAFREVNVEEDAEGLRKVKALGYSAAPVVLVNEGTEEQMSWSGNRPDMIRRHIVVPLQEASVA